jgi:hypothetical protein
MYTKEEQKTYYQTHKEEMKANQQKYLKSLGFSSPAEYQKERRSILRKEVLSMLGDKCVRCGFSDPRALQIDHIHGGGRKDRKAKDGTHPSYYKKVLDLKGIGYQLLCANCNWIKRYENNEHN